VKIAIINDTHFGTRGDSKIFLDYQEKFYSNIFFPELERRGIQTLLHLGDLFDRRKYVNFVTLKRTKEMFLNPLKDRNITVHGVVGNHDTSFKNTNEVNTIDLLLKEYENYNVYVNEPVTLNFGNCNIMLSPWICSSNSEVSFKAFKETKAKVLMGHFEFAGFEMMKGQLSDHGLDRSEFKKYSSVYSGHYHHPSSHENITYLGAPYEMTWTDYGGKRGFHIFDTETCEIEFVQNQFSIFHKLDYDDEDLSVEDIAEIDVSPLTQAYVKVIVKKKNNPYVFDLFIDKLQSAGCADIKVVEDHLNFDIISEGELVDEAQDTLSLLKTYVEGLEVKANKARINEFLRDLYQEALSL
jgi:DNA repair exonuclease SbcCD nuclease subunit